MKTAIGVALAVAVAAIGALAFLYSGVYDVAATTPHFDVTFKMMRTAMERSVKRQARNVKVPELDDPEKVHAGLKNFQEMCVVCHGAPGALDSQINQGLYPKAPNLAAAAKDWTPAELYVITKNGIKMSGMPAWGPTHSDEELWSLVAFLKLFPTMPPAEYRGAVEYFAKSGKPSGHGH